MGKPGRRALIVGSLVIVGVAILALVGGGALFVMRHVGIEPATNESARDAFETARRPFADRTPMIEIGVDGSVKSHVGDPSRAKPAPLTMLHVLAWDPDQQRLVRADIPFWALRFKNTLPGMHTEVPLWILALQGERTNSSRLVADGPTLRIEDLERFGAGLIIDAEIAGGRRVLMWAE